MQPTTAARPLPLFDAVQQYVDEIDRRIAVDNETARLRRIASDERCAIVAYAITERIARDEHVATVADAWFVTEREEGHWHYFHCEYNADAPGAPLNFGDDGDEPASGVCINNLGPDGSTVARRQDGNGEWIAYHKSNSGRSFQTFIAAITFAMTGRQ